MPVITGARLVVASRVAILISPMFYGHYGMYKDARDEYVVCVGARPPRGGRDKPGVRSPTEYNTIYNTKSISNTIQYKYNSNPMSITLRECFAGDENIRCDATRQVDYGNPFAQVFTRAHTHRAHITQTTGGYLPLSCSSVPHK